MRKPLTFAKFITLSKREDLKLEGLLKRDLLARWASIIEEDLNCEGFWDDVERNLGHHPSPQEVAKTQKLVLAIAQRVRGLR